LTVSEIKHRIGMSTKFKWAQDWHHVWITMTAKGAGVTGEAERVFDVTEVPCKLSQGHSSKLGAC